jgi:hypothetical protein
VLLLLLLAGELYQHFELGTAEIGILQEVTDEALDATAAAHQHHHIEQQEQQQQHAAAGDVDLEKAVTSAAAGSLTDWRQLKARLETRGWGDRLSRMCCTERLGQPLQQQQVRHSM